MTASQVEKKSECLVKVQSDVLALSRLTRSKTEQLSTLSNRATVLLNLGLDFIQILIEQEYGDYLANMERVRPVQAMYTYRGCTIIQRNGIVKNRAGFFNYLTNNITNSATTRTSIA